MLTYYNIIDKCKCAATAEEFGVVFKGFPATFVLLMPLASVFFSY